MGIYERLEMELETQDNIFRHLKGIIFGKEYSHKGGRLTEKDKPSILKKIEFVKQNISVLGNKYGFDYQQISSIRRNYYHRSSNNRISRD